MNELLWPAVILSILILILPYLICRKPAEPKRDKHYAYLLILGCPTLKDGSLSPSQQRRIQAALSYISFCSIDTIILSGSNVKTAIAEADIMAEALAKLRPDVTIKKERKARNTYQNMLYTKALYGEDSVLIVTSDAHLRRSAFFARKFYADASLGSGGIHDSRKEYIKEYFRMWNALYWEIRLWLRSKLTKA